VSDLTNAIQEERAKRRARVDACRAALAAAEADENAFLEEIGVAAGLRTRQSPAIDKVAIEARRKQILSLYEQGRTATEIASELTLNPMLVHADVKVLRERGLIASSKRVAEENESILKTKKEQVLALYLEGNAITAIAEQLKITRESVDQHLRILRKEGRLPSVSTVQSTSAATDETIDVDDGDEDGASLDDLKAEVLRQQDGKKGKPVFLYTTPTRSHVHEAIVDHFGDGHTTSDASGHVHRVYRFVLSAAHNHRHDLKLKG